MPDDEPMIRLEEAWAMVDAALAAARLPAETVAVRAAAGRVLAAGAASRLDLPAFDKSAMDGYAILAGDDRTEYRLVEVVPAGRVPTRQLEPGTTIKVMTGSPVPDGAGRVIPHELTEQTGELVRILRRDLPACGWQAGSRDNISRRGEDIRAGRQVLPVGRTLDAADVANLVACGVTEVQVARRLRVAVISTGDEIVDDPGRIEPGKIMNANGPMLAQLATDNGMAIADQRTVPDDRPATAEALRAGLRAADVVLMSGGVSVGEFDYALPAMADAALTVRFSRLAVKPGKPTVFATAGATGTGTGSPPWGVPVPDAPRVVFGLPGNPVSAYVMFHLLVLRAARLLSGAAGDVRQFHLPLAGAFRRRETERLQFVPARLTTTGQVQPIELHGSAHLLALTEADGFFAVPIGAAELATGDAVTFFPMGRPLR